MVSKGTAEERRQLKFRMAEARKAEAAERKQRSKERMLEKKLERQREVDAQKKELLSQKKASKKQRISDLRKKQFLAKSDKVSKKIASNIMGAFAAPQTSASMERARMRHAEKMMKMRMKQQQMMAKRQQAEMVAAQQDPRFRADEDDRWLEAPEHIPLNENSSPLGSPASPVRRGFGGGFGNILNRFRGRMMMGGGFAGSDRPDMMSQLGRQDLQLLNHGTARDMGSMNPLHAKNVMNRPGTATLHKSQVTPTENIWRTRKQKLNFWNA